MKEKLLDTVFGPLRNDVQVNGARAERPVESCSVIVKELVGAVVAFAVRPNPVAPVRFNVRGETLNTESPAFSVPESTLVAGL